MSKSKSIVATVVSLGTAALTLAKELVTLWRSKGAETVTADRGALDELQSSVTKDRKR